MNADLEQDIPFGIHELREVWPALDAEERV
jgi:hypothetical protein